MMKIVIFILASVICLGAACEDLVSKPIYRYEVKDGDLIVIPAGFYFVLFLNGYQDEKTIDRFEIVSRGNPVKFSFKNRDETQDPYILIESDGGGSGLATRELTIVSIENKKFKEVGHFYLNYEENPRNYLRVHIDGEVKFESENEITYSWKKSGHNHNKNISENGIETYKIKDGVFVRVGKSISKTACEGVWLGCDFLNCCPKE